MVNTATTVRTTCSYRCRVLRQRVFTNATVTIALVTLCFVYIILPFPSSSPPSPRFHHIRARVHACTYLCVCARARAFSSSFLSAPSHIPSENIPCSPDPSHHDSSTIIQASRVAWDRRKGVRETVGGDGKGREKGFKRVNASRS